MAVANLFRDVLQSLAYMNEALDSIIAQVNAELASKIPSTQFQIVVANFIAADTDLIIPHTLTIPTPDSVMIIPVLSGQPCLVYRDERNTRTAWVPGSIRVRCTAATRVVLLLMAAQTAIPLVAGTLTRQFRLPTFDGGTDYLEVKEIGTSTMTFGTTFLGPGFALLQAGVEAWQVGLRYNGPTDNAVEFVDWVTKASPLWVRLFNGEYFIQPDPLTTGLGKNCYLGNPNDAFKAGWWTGLYALTLNTDALKPEYKVRVFHSTTQSVNDSTLTALNFDSEDFDTNALHSTSVNTSRLVAPAAGVYLVTGKASFASNAVGLRYVRLRKNGADEGSQVNTTPVTGDVTLLEITAHVNLAANDYVELVVFQSSGGALNSSSATRVNTSEFSMARVW